MPLSIGKTTPKAKGLPGHATLIYGSSDQDKRDWDAELTRQCQAYGLGSKSDLLKALVIIASANDAVMTEQVSRLKSGQQPSIMVFDGAKPADKTGK